MAKKLAAAVILFSILAATTARADYIDLTDYKQIGGSSCDTYEISPNEAFLTSTCFVQYVVEDMVSFDWFFSTDDQWPGQDYAWFYLGVPQEYTTLATVQTVSGGDSGWQTYNLGYKYSGMIQFGVRDFPHPGNDIDSTLTIRNVTVPEPSTIALLGIGLFGMGLMRRRRRV